MTMHELFVIKWLCKKREALLKSPSSRDHEAAEWMNGCWRFHNDYDSTHYSYRDQCRETAHPGTWFHSRWHWSKPEAEHVGSELVRGGSDCSARIINMQRRKRGSFVWMTSEIHFEYHQRCEPFSGFGDVRDPSGESGFESLMRILKLGLKL